ncbi:MAG: hypothetical protein K8S16_20015 [Bacteroidales bacterium]|nr:hypothetical protein [Bacteroidales bacterium]
MRKIAFLLLLIPMLLASNIMFGQNIVVTDDDSYIAKPSAMLDVKSDSKGLLIPRLTSAQRTGISTPETGLRMYFIIMTEQTGSIFLKARYGK